jgi:hypothetical protein
MSSSNRITRSSSSITTATAIQKKTAVEQGKKFEKDVMDKLKFINNFFCRKVE